MNVTALSDLSNKIEFLFSLMYSGTFFNCERHCISALSPIQKGTTLLIKATSNRLNSCCCSLKPFKCLYYSPQSPVKYAYLKCSLLFSSFNLPNKKLQNIFFDWYGLTLNTFSFWNKLRGSSFPINPSKFNSFLHNSFYSFKCMVTIERDLPFFINTLERCF